MADIRIVSLIASATEIVCALGYKDYLVGRSHECDYPEEIKALPICTSVKFAVDGSSYQIDQRVKAILQEGLSVYKVSAEMLEKLQPTHLVTQTQCEVCAVSLKDVEEAVCQMISSQPLIVSLEPNCLEDIWQDIKKVANALGATRAGEELTIKLKKRMEDVVERCKSVSQQPTVACIEWIEPLMSTGNWMPELVKMAAGINLFGLAGKHSPWMQWSQLVECNPDIIVVMPCGFDIERTLQEMHLISQKKEWKDLKAVSTNRVFVADGNQYFNRPGPRVVESLEILAEIFHPELFTSKYENVGWIRYKK
ncbi:MAG: cobalamin-binding protein [Blastocatellia bacterium]|nr:cobalamin-binding protein [Blastocatellia bacterium]